MNIEKFRLDSLNRENPFQVKLEANFDFYNRSATAEEQAEFVALGSELSSVYAPGDHFYMVLGEISYVENNANKILNNGNIHLRTTFNYRKKLSPELFAQAQYDDFRGLSDRLLGGAALRWNMINNDNFLLTFGTGPMYEYERWTDFTSDDVKEVRFIKVSSNVIIRWTIGEYIDFNSVFYYQVGYDNSINATRNRVTNSSNLNFRISEKIAFKTGLRFAYEDRPIIPITKFIYSVENGISLNF